MVQLNKSEAREIVKALLNNENEAIKRIIEKMETKSQRPSYIYGNAEIRAILRKALKEKRKVKIRYYSLSSEKTTNRIVDISQLGKDHMIAYCNLREEERVFAIKRIGRAAIMNESYSIPKGWSPQSIILNK